MMKEWRIIHLWGKGMEQYLGNIIMSQPQYSITQEKLEELVELWGDKRKVCYVTFE